MNSPLTSRDGEAGFFDTLLVLSQNLRLLVMGPLIVATVVVCILFFSPPRFTSQAILAVPVPVGPQAAAVMKSAGVLDAVLLSLNPGSNNPGDEARNRLAAKITATMAKDGLIRLDVTAPTSLEAQNTANFLIDAWLLTTKPAPQLQVELDKRLAHARQTLSAAQAIVATQKTALSSVAGLGELLDRYFVQILDIERAMSGLTRDVVVQAPTRASHPTERPYLVTFFQVMFGAEFFFLMWVLGRHALETAGRNPETSQKLGRMRASLNPFHSKRNPDPEKSGHTEGTQ